ncbi:cobalamin biosynthesis protein [Actinopolymorpha pittospori]
MTNPKSGLWLGLLLGAGLDALVGDPRRGHPVAAFGRTATALESRLWADNRVRGVAHVLACVGTTAVAGTLVAKASRSAPLRVTTVALSTWAVLGGTSLGREGAAMGALLERGDLAGARERLPHLCGRDPAALDAPELARATVESVAENTSDAVVAPLFWGAVAGVPGLLAYRAVNTLDAMVGHRNPRYERFGWAAARLDDLANLVPARLTGLLAAALAPLVGGSPAVALRIMRRDGAKHPSPNAGRCEAAFAGALGVRLGGRNVYYGDRVEERGLLGDGSPPETADIARAVRLSRTVGVASVALAAGACWLRSSRRSRGTERSRSRRGPRWSRRSVA